MQPIQQLRTEGGRQYIQLGLPLDLHQRIREESKKSRKSKTLLIVEMLDAAFREGLHDRKAEA